MVLSIKKNCLHFVTKKGKKILFYTNKQIKTI